MLVLFFLFKIKANIKSFLLFLPTSDLKQIPQLKFDLKNVNSPVFHTLNLVDMTSVINVWVTCTFYTPTDSLLVCLK